MSDDLQRRPEHLEDLQRKIEEGLEAARELKQLAAEDERQKRPKLRLIKGGLLGGAAWAGVEWLRRSLAATATLSALTVGGVYVAEQPSLPGSDPPEAITPPASTSPRTPPSTKPRPPRTSPLRTTARPTTVAVPSPVAPTAQSPTPKTTRTPAPTSTPTETPTQTPTQDPTPTTQAGTPTPCGVVEVKPLGVCLLPKGGVITVE